jgi:hypothetical protein
VVVNLSATAIGVNIRHNDWTILQNDEPTLWNRAAKQD